MKKQSKLKEFLIIIIAGLFTGAAAVVLSNPVFSEGQANPKNMGFCIACFLRDIAGSLSLHSAAKVQYMRPEILGIIIGAFIIALITNEFKPKGGSSPFTRFVLGNFVMVGALVFLGCPLRMIIRLGSGDLNALVALGGFIVGILIGLLFLKKGFSLGRAYKQKTLEGAMFPISTIVLLILALVVPTLFLSSTEGPGSMHAPVIASLLIALVVGILAQRSRLCLMGGIRDVALFKDFKLILGFVCILVAVVIGNLITNNFSFSFLKPVAHSDTLWNILSMALVGWGSVLLGGCPLRQLVLAGEGNTDSAITVVGMITGAAFAHNFNLAGVADTIENGELVKAGGATERGKIIVIVGFAVLLFISLFNTLRRKKDNG